MFSLDCTGTLVWGLDHSTDYVDWLLCESIPKPSSVCNLLAFSQCTTLCRLLSAVAPDKISWHKSQLLTMYWYASWVTSPACGREISFKLASRWLIMMDRKITLSIMKLSNMYIKPQGNLDWVNMREGVLHPFISQHESSQFNLNSYSRQGWFIVSILGAHVWSCIHWMCGKR